MDLSKDIMALLKEQTADLHQSTELLFFPNGVDFNSFTIDQYRLFILSSYLFNKSLENGLTEFLTENQKTQLNFFARQKAPLAEKDLLILDCDFKKFDVPKLDIPNFETALGLMYVSEGSTLGGNVIKRALEKTKSFSVISNYNYLGCYGENIREMWVSFVSFCNHFAKTNNQKLVMIDAAKAGFIHLKNCFEKVQ